MSTDTDRDGRQPVPATPEITFQDIRERAYELWERHHRPAGFEVELWLLAERELRAARERPPAAEDADRTDAQAPQEPGTATAGTTATGALDHRR